MSSIVGTRRSFLAGLFSCPVCLAASPEWNYGDKGPEQWSKLDPAFAVCGAGDQQSPVDLHDGIKARLPSLRLNWKPAQSTVWNNHHTIQVNVPEGSSLQVESATWKLAQFHFHSPGEHTVSGKSSAMEIHFVHQQPGGNITVLGVNPAGWHFQPLRHRPGQTAARRPRVHLALQRFVNHAALFSDSGLDRLQPAGLRRADGYRSLPRDDSGQRAARAATQSTLSPAKPKDRRL
jgi:hypothetical protein